MKWFCRFRIVVVIFENIVFYNFLFLGVWDGVFCVYDWGVESYGWYFGIL